MNGLFQRKKNHKNAFWGKYVTLNIIILIAKKQKNKTKRDVKLIYLNHFLSIVIEY